MAHTPGPWTAECVGSTGAHDNPTDVYEVLSRAARVCEFATEVDAKLIAAAPELLAACEAVMRDFRNFVSENPIVKGESPCITDVRAAIKKARGE